MYAQDNLCRSVTHKEVNVYSRLQAGLVLKNLQAITVCFYFLTAFGHLGSEVLSALGHSSVPDRDLSTQLSCRNR